MSRQVGSEAVDEKLKRAESIIADHLVEIERVFNRPMTVMFIAHDPANDECSLLLTNARPGTEAASLAVADKIIRRRTP